MNISFLSMSFPFPKLKIDNSKTEFEIFSTNFRAMDHEPIIKSIESKTELKKVVNLSTVLRLVGNDHFKAGEFTLAFQFYYQSIALAPVDSLEFALALGNRSAVFFAVKNYTECLKDIEYVLKLNYPQNKLLKIYIRQTECYLNLNQNYDAVKAWAKATSCTDQFKNTQHAGTIQNKIMNLIRTSQVFNMNIRENPCPKPDLKNGENAEFLNASNSVELKSNDTKGRYVVAKNNIEPGDVLFVEEPYSAVIINNSQINNIYCNNCLIFAPANIPCKYCAVHSYCSDRCRETAWAKAHKWECFGERKQLLTYNNRLVLNLIFKASRDNFNTVVEDNCRYGNKIDNFAFVNKLATNKNQMTDDEVLVFTQHTIYLVIYLKKFTDYFEWLHDQPKYAEKSMSDLFDFIGGNILKLFMQVFCNYDEIVDVDIFMDESPEINIDHIGCGLYVSSAMMNHSCEPNALISFYQDIKVVRALKKIPENTEITIDYAKYRSKAVEPYTDISFNHYKFKCKCPKCDSIRPKNERSPWACSRCEGKAFNAANSRGAVCTNAACNHCFDISSYRTLELIIGPNLLAATLTSDRRMLEGTLDIMKKIYHKENIKYVGYYFTAHALYFEKRDMKKCVEVSKKFVEFADQFDEINDMKLHAYLRLTESLTMYYIKLKLNPTPIIDTILHELRSSLNETKRILTYYVQPKIIRKYEDLIKTFLNEFIQEPLI